MKELYWRQQAHHLLLSQQGPHFSPNSTAKTNNTMVSSGYSDVAFASVYSEEVDDDNDYYY